MESLDQVQARHLKELKDLQGRITNKKKSATKKTRKFVSDECADLERNLRERQEAELRALNGEPEDHAVDDDEPNDADAADEVSATSPNPAADATPTLDPSTLQQPPEQQQQQPGKKRNRQKERLARRAAEQEATIEAAAAEASNMVDHRSNEAAHMARELAAHSLIEREIAPDGHCLFSAVADQLSSLGIPISPAPGQEGDDDDENDDDDSTFRPPYRVVRHTAARYIKTHSADFEPFLEEPLDVYLRKIRDENEWGGHMELLALASTYDVEICVVADGRTAVVRPMERERGEKKEGDPPSKIWLAYYRHGFGLGEHYNSLRRKTATS